MHHSGRRTQGRYQTRTYLFAAQMPTMPHASRAWFFRIVQRFIDDIAQRSGSAICAVGRGQVGHAPQIVQINEGIAGGQGRPGPSRRMAFGSKVAIICGDFWLCERGGCGHGTEALRPRHQITPTEKIPVSQGAFRQCQPRCKPRRRSNPGGLCRARQPPDGQSIHVSLVQATKYRQRRFGTRPAARPTTMSSKIERSGAGREPRRKQRVIFMPEYATPHPQRVAKHWPPDAIASFMTQEWSPKTIDSDRPRKRRDGKPRRR